ncbi:hypothetical protein [Dehalococcoides mccartyi]|uniref:hypothetical protein n=1 Tax=Dehalococcoides mccartyi TaxID=61435 RepID=UPI0026EFB54A|nr:hypothetical protein [Dehalococcoides mccartyi]
MSEFGDTAGVNVMGVVATVLNSKHAPLYVTVIGIVGAFIAYEYFETVSKGMNLGYDSNATFAIDCGLQFTKQSRVNEIGASETPEETNDQKPADTNQTE